MIVTLTPNPSLDKTYHVGTLARGEVARVQSVSIEAAGKGVNVARGLHANGNPVVAVIPIGGPDGNMFFDLLTTAGVPFRSVPTGGNLRTNVSVVERDGTVTKLNEPGPELTSAEIDALISTAVGESEPGGWLVASGSLSPGMPGGFYAEVAAKAREAGVRFALDTSGKALAAGVEGRPALVKPNIEELRELTGLPLPRVADIAAAAQRIVSRGVKQVLVSLGAEGALLVSDSGVIHGRVQVDTVLNTVGAGDTLLAGFLAGGDQPQGALATALEWARAAVRSPTTAMQRPNETDRHAVTISDRVPAELVVEGP